MFIHPGERGPSGPWFQLVPGDSINWACPQGAIT